MQLWLNCVTKDREQKMISIKKITEIARHVYKTLGPCHAESIYRDAMSIQLQEELSLIHI